LSEATKLILILILSCLIVSILDKQTNFSSLSALVTTDSRKSHLFFGFFVFIDRFSLRLSTCCTETLCQDMTTQRHCAS